MKRLIIVKTIRLRQVRNLLLVLVFSVSMKPVCAQTKPGSNKSAMIGQALTEIVNEGKAPGMIAAIISAEGVTAISSAGVRKEGSGIAFTTSDFVHLGSCTKAMTAAMIGTLVAEGKIKWDTKLVDVIPELKGVIHPDYYTVTLWQLLTHCAGVPSNSINWDAYGKDEIKERRLSILKDNLKSPAAFAHGEHHYSNFGYMVAGCMAERITGLSWESLMRTRLFDPLGMNSAGFGVPGNPAKTDQPWGHGRYGGHWQPSMSYDAEAIGPAGEVHCNIQDWAKFLSLWLADKNPILDSTVLNKLTQPVGFYAGGWGVSERPWANGKVLSHNGSNGIWYATVIVAPKLKRAYVVVTNSREFGSTEDICSDVLSKLIRMDLN